MHHILHLNIAYDVSHIMHCALHSMNHIPHIVYDLSRIAYTMPHTTCHNSHISYLVLSSVSVYDVHVTPTAYWVSHVSYQVLRIAPRIVHRVTRVIHHLSRMVSCNILIKLRSYNKYPIHFLFQFQRLWWQLLNWSRWRRRFHLDWFFLDWFTILIKFYKTH